MYIKFINQKDVYLLSLHIIILFVYLFFPLVGALAAGNKVVLKPSERTKHTSNLLKNLLKSLDSDIEVLEGGKETVCKLLEEPFDHFFFTGSERVGRKVAQAAALQLSTITLELGGKCPAVVWKPKNLKLSLSRVLWAKFFNAGQTCVAPDYIVVEESDRKYFLHYFNKIIDELFPGRKNCCSPFYQRLVDDNHQQRVLALLKDVEVKCGGRVCTGCGKLEPTLVLNPPIDHPLCHEEIFGPILVVHTVKDLIQIEDIISKNPNPLAVYILHKRVLS